MKKMKEELKDAYRELWDEFVDECRRRGRRDCCTVEHFWAWLLTGRLFINE